MGGRPAPCAGKAPGIMKKLLAALAGLFCSAPVFANPADYVYTPIVEYGEREIDTKFGYASALDGNNDLGGSIGFGYGAKEYWFTEVYLKRQREGGDGSTLAEWENKFQFTETGKYPVDAGFITEVEAPINGSAPWELRVGPLFQSEFGKLQLNGNLLFERNYGSTDRQSMPFSTVFSYQWQAKYRWRPVLEFGLQGLGSPGVWNDWSKADAQDHRIGPAAFGVFRLGNHRQAIRYNAAWLIGASQAAPNHIFRMQVEYEF
jgi:hypothetical protein